LKQSWNGTHWINDLLRNVLDENTAPWKEYPFDIHGADERQFSSQAFRVNVATVSKDRYYEYPEYHTSADNLDLVTPAQLHQSLELYLRVIDKMEELRFFRNKQPNCEVMMSKHDLYPKFGGAIKPIPGAPSSLSVALWLLFYLDGNTPLSSISTWTGIPVDALEDALGGLVSRGIVEEVLA
jgi:aminopeptidase-like protein